MDLDDIIPFIVFIAIFIFSLFSKKKGKGGKSDAEVTPEQQHWLEALTGIRVNPVPSEGPPPGPSPSKKKRGKLSRVLPREVMRGKKEKTKAHTPPPIQRDKREEKKDGIEEMRIEDIEVDEPAPAMKRKRCSQYNSFCANTDQLRKAVVWSEILAKPIGLREEDVFRY